MHCTLFGARALLRLCCVALHGEWEAFTHERIQQETARLYLRAELVEHAPWFLPVAACYIDADGWLWLHGTHNGPLNH
jgi:hypothetical protein